MLASTHVIEDAPLLARVNALKSVAQDIIVRFASDMLAIAKQPKPVVGPDGSRPSAVSDASTWALRSPIEAHYSY